MEEKNNTTDDIMLAIMPPCNVEAEQAIISNVINDNDLLDRITFLRPEHFFIEFNKKSYQEILTLRDNNKPIDSIILKNAIKESSTNTITNIETIDDYMSEHIELSEDKIYEYALIVYKRYSQRMIIEYCEEAKASCYNYDKDIDSIVETLTTKLEIITSHQEIKTAFDAVSNLVDQIRNNISNQISYIKTGDPKFDAIIALPYENIFILGGDKSSGI